MIEIATSGLNKVVSSAKSSDRCINKKTIPPVETTTDWTEKLDHNKYWKVNMHLLLLAMKVYARAWEKIARDDY